MALNYANHIHPTLSISYADLLERIQDKCGNLKFKLSKHKFKQLRVRRWQEMATSAKVSLAKVIYDALQRMADESDPCIEVLDGSSEIGVNVELRLIKLPPQQGSDSLKAISKDKLMAVAEERAHSIAALQAKVTALEKDKTKLQESVEVWKGKAGAVTIEPESIDDFPECYATLEFGFMIPRYLPGKLRRPRFQSAELWPGIKKNLPWIDTWQVQEFQKRHSKQTPQTRADEQAGLAPTKPSDRGAESRSAISHFFKFIKLTQGPNNKTFVPKQEHLLSKLTLKAFLTFYVQRVSSPNTANNVAKMLVNLYKHMKTMDALFRYGALIESLITMCHEQIRNNAEMYVIYRAKRLLDSHLVLRGEWLKPDELALLTKTICTEIVEFLDRTETEEQRNALKKTEVLEFQMMMILYSYLQLGGQRREVVAHFLVGNFAAVQDSVIYFTLLEKVQRRNSDRLPLPSTLGQLMRIWIEKYRPLLLADKELKCCWVNLKGEPLAYRSITQGVINKIAAIFPRRHVGPLMLRRILGLGIRSRSTNA